MMAPVAPHIAEELWERLGKPYSIHTQAWPAYDAELAREDEITLVVQVNGKVRDRIDVPADISQDEARAGCAGERGRPEAPGRQRTAPGDRRPRTTGEHRRLDRRQRSRRDIRSRAVVVSSSHSPSWPCAACSRKREANAHRDRQWS